VEPDHKIRSTEGLVLKAAVQKLQGEVADNRAEILRIRDEQIPKLEFDVIGLVGRILKKVDSISERLGIDSEDKAEKTPSANRRYQLEQLPPMREEQPSTPEVIAEIAREEANEVYDQRKSKSLFVREEKRQKSQENWRRDLRNAYIALAVAVAGAVTGAVAAGYYSAHATDKPAHTQQKD
jgi:hypothetical protein